MINAYFRNTIKYVSVALVIAVLSGGAYLYREHGFMSEAHAVNSVAVVPHNQVSQDYQIFLT